MSNLGRDLAYRAGVIRHQADQLQAEAAALANGILSSGHEALSTAESADRILAAIGQHADNIDPAIALARAELERFRLAVAAAGIHLWR